MTTPFLSRLLETLPGDVLDDVRPRQVQGALWSRVKPTPVARPRMLAFAPEVASLLGLSPEELTSEEGTRVMAGNALWPGMAPYAANYGGHQFGNWAGQLGDGRAIVLGERLGTDGKRYELQLKGAGPTPYSRRGDGRAVLRSSLREFLCSEAMHHLGVPTTRALCLVATGEDVVRDMFYDGHPAPEPGAVVCRVAPSFLRFGNFELPSSRGDVALLRRLADFTLEHYFPELGPPSPEAYGAFLTEVAQRTARLVAHWQAVGFVHGVMNTDNMSILGLTLDYGPYGWVDNYDPDWTPNTTDAQHGRYRFGNQPSIGLWNVARLAEALMPLLDPPMPVAEQALDAYRQAFIEAQTARYAAKLGLSGLRGPEDLRLLETGLGWLAAEETDFTLFFRGLSQVLSQETAPSEFPAALLGAFYGQPSPAHLERGVSWLRAWWTRTRADGNPSATERARAMDRVNPLHVPRNWLAQEAIDAAHEGDLSKLHELLDVLRHPFDAQAGKEAYASKRPDWARSKPGCSALSCSS